MHSEWQITYTQLVNKRPPIIRFALDDSLHRLMGKANCKYWKKIVQLQRNELINTIWNCPVTIYKRFACGFCS